MRATIWIVRHGETQANRDQILQGQMDTELNEDGVEQAKRVADSLKTVPFDVAFTSDLSRAAKVRSRKCTSGLWLILMTDCQSNSGAPSRCWSPANRCSKGKGKAPDAFTYLQLS